MNEAKFQDLRSPPVPTDFPGRSRYIIQIWYIANAIFFRLSPHFLYGWRRFLLRLFGAKIGIGVKIRPSATVTYPWNLSIGDHSYIGDEAVLYSLGKIDIGSHVSISYRSFLCTGSHDHTNENFRLIVKPIVINDQAWVATDVFVAPGVTIGKGSVIGARSSVFKDIPQNGIYSGSPAKYIRNRT